MGEKKCVLVYAIRVRYVLNITSEWVSGFCKIRKDAERMETNGQEGKEMERERAIVSKIRAEIYML